LSGLKTTTAIVEAISTRHLLVLDYHGKTRTVEPHTFGLDRWGRALLLWICGPAESWDNPLMGTRYDPRIRQHRDQARHAERRARHLQRRRAREQRGLARAENPSEHYTPDE